MRQPRFWRVGTYASQSLTLGTMVLNSSVNCVFYPYHLDDVEGVIMHIFYNFKLD